MSEQWQPQASMATLRQRAQLLARTRAFFAELGVWEVDTPLLASAGVTDPYLNVMEVAYIPEAAGEARTLYLQTSPEYAMKRLLAAGSGPIYQLGKVFRNGERSPRHNPEFTLLEWYRPGFNDQQLMDEVAALWHALGGMEPPLRISYREAFERVLAIDPHEAPITQLQALARQHCGAEFADERRDTWLELLMSQVVEPGLAPLGAVFVYDFPATQAALARVVQDERGARVGKRFELYIRGLEVANGYWELTDAQEQRRRFQADLVVRAQLQRPLIPLDERLLAAMQAGLPDCAGVAVGFDRLLMLLSGKQEIAEVIPFALERC